MGNAESCCSHSPFFLSSLPDYNACPITALLRCGKMCSHTLRMLRYFSSWRLALEQALYLENLADDCVVALGKCAHILYVCSANSPSCSLSSNKMGLLGSILLSKFKNNNNNLKGNL